MGFITKLGFDTGMTDVDGKSIRVGDILDRPYNEFYGRVRGVVYFDNEKGAFVASGEFADGGGWSTLNAEQFRNWKIVGDIATTPSEYFPATLQVRP